MLECPLPSFPRCLLRFGTPVAELRVPLPWLPTDDGPDPNPPPACVGSSSKRDKGLPKGESPPPLPPPNEAGPRYSVKAGLLAPDVEDEGPIAEASVLEEDDEDGMGP